MLIYRILPKNTIPRYPRFFWFTRASRAAHSSPRCGRSRRDCGSEMDSPTRQPPCAHPSTRRRPRSANPSLTTACTLVPVNSAHPDAQLTSLTRHVLLVDVRASDGMPPASPLSQPRADATLQSHSQLSAAAQVLPSRTRRPAAAVLEVPEQAVRASTDVAAHSMVLLAHERYVLWSGCCCRATCSSSSSSPGSVDLRMPRAWRPAVVVVLSTADGIALLSGLHVRAAAARGAARVGRRRDDARLRHRHAADVGRRPVFFNITFLKCNVCTIRRRCCCMKKRAHPFSSGHSSFGHTAYSLTAPSIKKPPRGADSRAAVTT